MLGSMLLHRTFILRCPFRFVGFDPSLLHIDDGFCVVYPRWNGLLWMLTLLTCRLLSLETNHRSSFRDPPMLNWKVWACNGARKLPALLGSENHASVVDILSYDRYLYRFGCLLCSSCVVDLVSAVHVYATTQRNATWLILPVVICLSQRLSHACVSMNKFRLWNCEWLIKSVIVCLMVSATRITVVILELIRATNPDFWKGCIY